MRKRIYNHFSCHPRLHGGNKPKYFSLIAFSFLTACSPAEDYQGIEPAVYMSRYPKEIRVVPQARTHTVYFESGAPSLSLKATDDLKNFLKSVEPVSASRVQITMKSPNDTRALALLREMRAAGYAKRDVRFALAPEMLKDTARIDIGYTVAETPDCPDWRKSGVTNYSNTNHSNLGCPQATNLGLMVADPQDLLEGSGDTTPNPDSVTSAISNYRTGGMTAAPASSASSGSSAAAGGSAAAAPQ